MGKYISLGEYNQLYVYIWMYLAIKFVSLFVFDYNFVFDQFHNEPMKIPLSPFITLSFNYLTFIIVSFIIITIKKFRKKKAIVLNLIQEQKLIYKEKDLDTEYIIEKRDYFIFINLGLIVITDLLWEIFDKMQISLLDYWTFELLFFEIFNSTILKRKYIHIIFLLCFLFYFFVLFFKQL